MTRIIIVVLPQYRHLDHVALVHLFEALNVDSNTGSNLAFTVEPAFDNENPVFLNCRRIEAQAPGGVRHIYTALWLRLSRRCRACQMPDDTNQGACRR
jgi:hypothetical protein